MNKLVYKTVIYTVISIVSAILICLGAMTIFFPSAMSDACAKLGMDKMSAKYSEVVYKRDDSFGNLLDVVGKSVYADDKKLIIRYGGELLDEPRFYSYSESKQSGTEMSYYNFIARKYITTCYEKGLKSRAFSSTFAYTYEFGSYNPVNSLIYSSYKSKDKETLENIYIKLEPLTIEPTIITQEELERIREETPSVTLVERSGITEEEKNALTSTLKTINEMISRIDQATAE